MLVDAGNLWPKSPFDKSAGTKKANCQRSNLRRTNSTEMKKNMRLKEAIEGGIRKLNDNPSQEKPSVTY
jgi:hypothetical protein